MSLSFHFDYIPILHIFIYVAYGTSESCEDSTSESGEGDNDS